MISELMYFLSDGWEYCQNYCGIVTIQYLVYLESAFMICRGLCACTEMVSMCVLYVSFGSNVRPRSFGCVTMGSALLIILRSRLLVYSAGSGINRVQVVLSGFSMRLFCFVQEKPLCRYGCMYFLAELVLVCVWM